VMKLAGRRETQVCVCDHIVSRIGDQIVFELTIANLTREMTSILEICNLQFDDVRNIILAKQKQTPKPCNEQHNII
jgi:hypothetical protein